jgi:hypothetical protein
MLFEGCFGRASLTYAAFTSSSFFFAPPRQIGAPESCMRALKTRVHVAMAGAPAAKRPAGLAFRGSTCIKNASERSESRRFGQYWPGTRHRENPYYVGLFSRHTGRPGPLEKTSNPAGAKILLILPGFSRHFSGAGSNQSAAPRPFRYPTSL